MRDRASVVIGKSGVGKSSILNVIQPGLGLRVSEISERTGKGRHTTTHLELFDLEVGGNVIDTPGMREFGLWNIAGEMKATLFPELRPYTGECRFAGCTHSHEPGCAVKDAVESGVISRRRYESFLKM